MRREGRQHGWVLTYDRDQLDPKRRRRAAQAVAGQPANGGFVRVPRKPSNHSKFTGEGKEAGPYCYSKGRLKFKHDELKMCYMEAADALDGELDDLYAVDL